MILWNTIFLLIVPGAGKYDRRQILMAKATITKKSLKMGNQNPYIEEEQTTQWPK